MISDAHRPWPVPKSPWLLRQVWNHVLFAHWPVAPDRLRPSLPKALQPHLDSFEGAAWIGIVGFGARGTRVHGLPAMPGLADFLELNVRTYVTIGGKPGVYFFSLDTPHRLAVVGARMFFDLPYFPAQMSMDASPTICHLTSQRAASGAAFDAQYRPSSAPVPATTDAMTTFLAERYALYTASPDVTRVDIHHAPWRLSTAEARLRRNTMTVPLGLPLPDNPICHFSVSQEAFIWPPTTVHENEGAASPREPAAAGRVPL